MQLNKNQATLLFDTLEFEEGFEELAYDDLIKEVSTQLKNYIGKNLLAISYRDQGDGTKIPLLIFGEYDGLDPIYARGRELRFYFKKPILYTDIKIRRNQINRSSIRFRWCKLGYDQPIFRHLKDGFRVSIYSKRNFGLVHKNSLIYGVDFDRNWQFLPGRLNTTSLWDVTSTIIANKTRSIPNYENVYEFFHYKYQTDRSLA